MTGTAEELPAVTFADFLRSEERAARRHEYVGGRVYVMAGGSERHELVTGLVYEALAAGARTAGCRPFLGNRLVRAGEAAYYPDILVVCAPAADRLYETDASLIVEVLSPSTESTDRREKTAAYATLSSMGLYVLVDPQRRRLEVAQVKDGRATWQVFGAGGVVPTRYGTLVVDDLYDVLDASATTP